MNDDAVMEWMPRFWDLSPVGGNSVLAPIQHSGPTMMRATPVACGLSGGQVFRIDVTRLPDISGADGGLMGEDARQIRINSFALKAWPEGSVVDRIVEIHRRIGSAAQSCELLAPPEVCRDGRSTIAIQAGRNWELSRWIGGRPLESDASSQAVGDGGRAIGRVHLSLRNQAASGSDARLRCLDSRIDRLSLLGSKLDEIRVQTRSPETLAERLIGQIRSPRPQPAGPGQNRLGSVGSADDPEPEVAIGQLAETLREASDLLGHLWPKYVPPLIDRLRWHQRHAAQRTRFWVLRDVHREHVFFDRDGVTGVIDYDALAIDSPAADLARWAGSFQGDRDARLDAAMAGYRDVCPFSEADAELAETLMIANAYGSLVNWLFWLALEGRVFSITASGLRGRISHLIASVSRI